MAKSIFNVDHQNEDLPSKIAAGLERLSEAFRTLLWEHAKVMGLSPIQIQLLIFVAYHPEDLCTVSQLAQEFNLTKPTISDAVKVLLKKGLIEKYPSPTDKRAYSIGLTEAGKQSVATTETFARPIRDIASQWPEQRQQDFFSQLSQMIHGLHQHGILAVQRSCHSCRFYRQKDGQAYCGLLEAALPPEKIRIDCPEYEEQ